ncbi:hypothetical protein ACX0HA_13110 [Flavobacterium hauense]
MNIEYLKLLKIHNKIGRFANEGISEAEIAQLEGLYNNGNPFPKVLKELLFLAGNYCNVLDYNIYDSQQELQDDQRNELEEDGVIISRPYFFVDLSSHGLPGFIFLDEGENPQLNQIINAPSQSNYYRRTGGTLQNLIDSRIKNYLDGFNPF